MPSALIDTLKLGTVGTSGSSGDGSYKAHLHWGVFLAEEGLKSTDFNAYKPWVKSSSDKSTINPLLFIIPDGCSITDPRN